MPAYNTPELSAREYQILENEKEGRRETFEHAVTIKRLELALEQEKHKAELDMKLTETKWSSLLSLPRYVLKLPVLMVMGVAYMIHAIRKSKPSQEFWDFLKK